VKGEPRNHVFFLVKFNSNRRKMMTTQSKFSTIRFDDNLGGLAYPFLPDEWQWQILSRPLGDATDDLDAALPADPPTPAVLPPALRWVKDDKVLDLFIPNVDTAEFLARTGLQLSMRKGAFVLSKRLSRVMRPYRYWGFFGADEVAIDYNEQLDPKLWDGCGQVSRGFVQRLADSLDPSAEPVLSLSKYSGQGLDDRHRRELLGANRFEVTTLHAGGQDKGHVLVVDDLAVDFVFPSGSAKTELALPDGRVFVGLQPIHNEDQMCLDIQSLINLYPFFRLEQLLAWAQMESELFLSGIRDGRLEKILNRLYDAESVADLDSLADWHVGEYIASGGSLMWFAGMVKAVARQHLNRLGSRASKLRCPAPGGRYYIFPAAVGDRAVPAGHVELDPACATAWVNDEDWLDHIVAVLGGCDGDDAVWVLSFRDGSDRSAEGNRPVRKVLLWRSPNQPGEYLVLKPTAGSHTIQWDTLAGSLSYPQMQSRLLPPRIDSVTYQYGSLAEASDPNSVSASYSIAATASTIQRAADNRGVLGAHCNALMLCKAIYGRLPAQLPATLEDVIDGSVKTGLDLAPVKQWNQMAIARMVKHGQTNAERAMPAVLLDRLPAWLRPQARVADGHWLDTLTNALEQHKAQYWADVEALAAEAYPPIEVFEHGREWLPIGKELRQEYSRIMRQVAQSAGVVDAEDETASASDGTSPLSASFAAARAVSEAFLQRWPAEKQVYVLLGAAAYLYAQGPQNGEPVRDGLLWQLGRPREGGGEDGRSSGRLSGIAHMTIQALRHVGLLGEPLWTSVGAVLHVAEAPCPKSAGVPVRINGTWLNWLNSRNGHRYARMSDVPPAERDRAKARIADFVQDEFRGMLLFTEVIDDGPGGLRVITRTPHGNLFGYVQRDHELAAIRYDRWRIAWATSVDGNVLAVLEPVTA
jgi:hypothetical protein